MSDISQLLETNEPSTAVKAAAKASQAASAKSTPAPAAQGHNSMKEVAEIFTSILAVREEMDDLRQDQKELKKTLKEKHELDSKTITTIISLLESGEFEDYADRHARILNVYSGIKNAQTVKVGK